MATIRYWNVTSIDYTTNGDYIISPIECKYNSGGINGGETLTVTLQIDEDDNYNYVTVGGIIGSPTNYSNMELFRIKTIELDDIDMTMTLNCKLKSTDDLTNTYVYDSGNEDVNILDTGDVSAKGALSKLQKNLQIKYDKTRNYNLTTDIDGFNSRAKWEKKSIINALVSDDENSFINRWGGELFCKGNNIYLNRKIGQDRGVEILYGKNIESMQYTINADNMVTRIIPYGYDNIKLAGKTPWVNSTNINKWYMPLTQDRTYSSVKLKGNSANGGQDEGFDTIEQCRNELIRLAKEEFKTSKCDQPIVNIKIDMTMIRDTVEYKELGLSNLEDVQKGDTVHCKHYLMGIETDARVIGLTYDVLAEEIESVEIGEVNKSFFDVQRTTAQKLDSIMNGNMVKADVVGGILNAMNTTFKAQRDVSQTQQVRAMLFEDLVKGSPTFGACCIGTKGLEIANKRTPDGRDWNWDTFITSGHVIANRIDSGILSTIIIQSADGGKTAHWNLNTGEIHLSKGYIGNQNAHYSITDNHLYGKNSNIWLNTGEVNFAGDKFSIDKQGHLYIAHAQIDNATMSNSIINNAHINHGDINEMTVNKSNIKACNIYSADGGLLADMTNQINILNGKLGGITVNNGQSTINSNQTMIHGADGSRQSFEELRNMINSLNNRVGAIENHISSDGGLNELRNQVADILRRIQGIDYRNYATHFSNKVSFHDNIALNTLSNYIQVAYMHGDGSMGGIIMTEHLGENGFLEVRETEFPGWTK